MFRSRLFHSFRMFVLLLLLSSSFDNCSEAQTAPDVKQYVQQAQAAYKDKNYPLLIQNMKQALALRPNYGLYTYYIAIGYALDGNREEAIGWLNRLAEMGLVYNVAANEDFKSLRETNEFKAVLDKFRRNAQPSGNSVTAFTFAEKGLVPEGLAYDPVEGTFYIGSVYKRKIVKVNAAGEAKDFSAPADGLWSVMGMRVDAARRLLWVCTASHQQMMNYDAAEKGLSGIYKYNLKTGELLKKYLLPSQVKGHWLGDLVLNSQGDVFATDSVSPAIYFLNRKTDSLELFLESNAFVNPQGLAFSADGKRLFMADYLKGVFAIDVKTKALSLLTPAGGSTMLGIDGLYYHRGKLIAVQNGVNPNRLVQMSLDKRAASITRFEVLEANNPSFDEPTLGVLDGDNLFYIANSQWGMIDEKGNLGAEDKLKQPIIMKLKLL